MGRKRIGDLFSHGNWQDKPTKQARDRAQDAQSRHVYIALAHIAIVHRLNEYKQLGRGKLEGVLKRHPQEAWLRKLWTRYQPYIGRTRIEMGGMETVMKKLGLPPPDTDPR